ncbi:MAG: hypothetical protein ACKO4M_09465 [Betaproteobacteria bacterium]
MPQTAKPPSQPPSQIKPAVRRVRGLDLDKPRPTAAGWALIMLYFAVPGMLLGAFIDILIQWASGECVGLWCWLFK